MRPEKLVGGASEKIAIPGLNIDGAVRPVMHGVQKYQGASKCASLPMDRTSFTVPTALEATTNRDQARFWRD